LVLFADVFVFFVLVIFSQKVPRPSGMFLRDSLFPDISSIPKVNDTRNLILSAVGVGTGLFISNIKLVHNAGTQAPKCAHTNGVRRLSAERRQELAG